MGIRMQPAEEAQTIVQIAREGVDGAHAGVADQQTFGCEPSLTTLAGVKLPSRNPSLAIHAANCRIVHLPHRARSGSRPDNRRARGIPWRLTRYNLR